MFSPGIVIYSFFGFQLATFYCFQDHSDQVEKGNEEDTADDAVTKAELHRGVELRLSSYRILCENHQLVKDKQLAHFVAYHKSLIALVNICVYI